MNVLGMKDEIISSVLYRCTWTNIIYVLNVRVHEISGQTTLKPLHYQYKATPSYILVYGNPAGMENLNPNLWGLLILLQAVREFKVLINIIAGG